MTWLVPVLRTVTRSVNEPGVDALPVLRVVHCTVADCPDCNPLGGVSATPITLRSGATLVSNIGVGGCGGLGASRNENELVGLLSGYRPSTVRRKVPVSSTGNVSASPFAACWFRARAPSGE